MNKVFASFNSKKNDSIESLGSPGDKSVKSTPNGTAGSFKEKTKVVKKGYTELNNLVVA